VTTIHIPHRERLESGGFSATHPMWQGRIAKGGLIPKTQIGNTVHVSVYTLVSDGTKKIYPYQLPITFSEQQEKYDYGAARVDVDFSFVPEEVWDQMLYAMLVLP